MLWTCIVSQSYYCTQRGQNEAGGKENNLETFAKCRILIISSILPRFPCVVFLLLLLLSAFTSRHRQKCVVGHRGNQFLHQYILCRVSRFWKMQEKQTEEGERRSENVDPAQKVISLPAGTPGSLWVPSLPQVPPSITLIGTHLADLLGERWWTA